MTLRGKKNIKRDIIINFIMIQSNIYLTEISGRVSGGRGFNFPRIRLWNFMFLEHRFNNFIIGY